MEKEIRRYLKEILYEDRYRVKDTDIKIIIMNKQNFSLVFNGGCISVTMSNSSDLKKCIRDTLNNYADHHNI